MSLPQKLSFLLLVVIAFLGAASDAFAQACAPSPGFVDVPHPTLAAPELLVSHTEEITVDQPLTVVLDSASRTDLKDAIHKSSSLPGVSGEHPLNNISFPMPGARRLACLSDGSTLEEKALELERNQTSSRFPTLSGTTPPNKRDRSNTGLARFSTRSCPGDAHKSSGPTRSSSRIRSFRAIWVP